MARGILVPQLGMKPEPSALETWNLNHCITRKIPTFITYKLPTLWYSWCAVLRSLSHV